MATKSKGDRIKVLAHPILGTPESMATILTVESYGYIVHIDGDAPGWFGPINFEGVVLQEGP